MAAEDYSIRINVDSTSATQAQRNLQNLSGSVSNAERAMQTMGQMSRASAAAIAGLQTTLNSVDRATNMTAQAMSAMASSMSRVEKQLANTSTQARNTTQSFGGLNSVLGAFGVATGIAGVAALTKNIVTLNMEMESLRARLNMTLPSLSSAQNAFALITKIAAETPQSIQEITKAFLLLRNSGLSTSEKDLRGWTDMAAKFGAQADDLTGVIRQFGQAMMKGKLQAQDTNAMIERGIPVYALLKDVTGKSAAEILKMAEAGEINTKIMEQMKQKLFEISSGSSMKAMDTLKGKIEALGSAWTGFVDALLQDKSEGIMKRLVDDWAAALEGFTAYLNKSTDRQISDKQARLAELEAGFKADKLTYLKPNTTKTRLSEYEQEGIALTKLLNKRQDAIDESAQMEKMTREQKQAEELKANQEHEKALERGDNEAIKKSVSAKLAAMKDYQSKMIEIESAKYDVPANLVKALASVESTFSNKAVSPVGAAGLFQIMPKNLKARGTSTSEVLSSEQKSVEVGTKMIAETWKKAGYDIEKFWTLWNAGHLRLTKEGAFSMALQPKETRAAMPVLIEAYKQLGGEMGDLTKLQQAHSTSTKSLASEQEQAAKQQQALIDKFSDKDPLEKYIADMAELNSIRDKLKPEVFVENERLIAESFLKSTVDLQGYNESLRERERLFEQTARGKFEKGTEELRAQKPFMSESEYSSKQDKLAADYLTQQQGKDFKTSAEQTVEATKGFEELNKKLSDTATAFDNVGNSSKMAFDGLLGGVSAVAGAIGSFSDEMTKLQDGFTNGSKAYSDFMLQEGTTFEQREKATADYYKMKDKYESSSFKAEISGARQLAGAAKNLFGEKSAARKAFHAVEMGMSVIEMAMAAKKMIVDVAAGAANMFAQGGFAGFAGVAAMAAVMGGLGFAMSGGSSKAVDNTAASTNSTGTILGDSNTASNSVREIVDTLNDIHAQEFPELQAISDGFRGLDNSMYKMNQIILQSTANFKNTQAIGVPTQATGAKAVSPNGSIGMQAGGLATSTAMGAAGLGLAGGGLAASAATAVGMGTATSVGVGVGSMGMMVGGAIVGLAGGLILAGLQYGLGKLLGIGKTKITQLGEGIVINANSLLTDGMFSALDAQTWRKDEFKTKGWFSSKKRIVETFGALSDDVYSAIAGAIGAVTNGSLILADELNILDDVRNRMELQGSMPALKLDWFAQKNKGEDVSKLFNETLNAYYDRIATNLFKYYIGEFQQLGEGMLQTAARVTIEMKVVQGAYAKLGYNIGEGSVGLAGLSDRLIQMYNSTADAKDGLKNFMEVMNDIYNLTHTEGQKSQKSITDVKKALTSPLFEQATGQKFDETKITDKKYTLEMYALLNDSVVKLSATAAEYETKVKDLSPAVEMYHNPNSGTDLSGLASVFTSILGTSDYSKAQWENVGGGWTEAAIRGMAGKHTLWDSLIKSLDINREQRAFGAAAGGASKTPAQQAAELKAAEAASVAAAETLKATQGLIYDVEGLNKTIDKLSSIQDEYLKTTMSAKEWKGVEQNRIIEQSFKDITENMRDHRFLDPVTDAMIKADKTGEKYTKTLEDGSKIYVISAEQLQRYTWSLEDAAEATKNLADSGKFLVDFGDNISKWVKNLRATQLGSPESQIKAAQANFEEQLKQAKFGVTGEEKRAALSGITGYADTYINAIKSFYGSSEQGQKALEEVISQVSGLEKAVPVAEMQLNALQDIKTAIEKSTIEIPEGIAGTNRVFMTQLLSEAKQLSAITKANPTIENQLKYDALAKIVLMVDKTSRAGGDVDFLKNLVASIGGKEGLQAQVGLIVNDATLDSGKKSDIIDSVLNQFNESRLTLKNFAFDVNDVVASAKALVESTWNPPVLDVNDESAKTKITGLSDGLKEYDNSYYDSVVDVNSNLAFGKVAGANQMLFVYDNSYYDSVVDVNSNLAFGKVAGANQMLFVYDRSYYDSTIGVVDNASSGVIYAGGLVVDFGNKNTSATVGINGVGTVVDGFNQITASANAAKAAMDLVAVTKTNQSANDAAIEVAKAQNNYFRSTYGTGDIDVSKISQADKEKLAELAREKDGSRGWDTSKEIASGLVRARFDIKSTGNEIYLGFANKKSGGGFQGTSVKAYAKGGIANEPSIFGEAGTEAAVPLPDGRSIPVTLNRAANDSSTNNAETVAELKEQNRRLEILVNTLMATSKDEREKMQELIDSMNGLRTDTRLKARA